MENQKRTSLILDIDGAVTGLPMTKARVISLIIAIAFFIIGSLLPLDSVHPLAGKGLGLVLCVIVLWVSSQFDLVFGAFVLAVGSVLLGIVPLGDMLTIFGNSNFISLMGMMILAMGATHTNFAKRVAYTFLSKFGKKPLSLLIAIGCSTVIISAFCSNLATVILMSSIAVGVLEGMEEQKSPFSKGLLISIPVFASIGGMALMSGSPAMNMVGITTLETASEGASTISYAQWAVIGIISSALLMVPAILIFKKRFAITNAAAKELDTSDFSEKLRNLGPMSGSEIRWCLETLAFVAIMLSGLLNLKINALLFACITICPIIGTVRTTDALKSLPLNILFLNGFAGLISTIFSTTNITSLLQSAVSGVLGGLPVLPLMLACALILTFLNNIFPNATAGIIALCISTMTPIVIGLGYNPSAILLPAIFIGSYNIVLGMQDINTLNYGYGYWAMTDPIVPNSLVCLCVVVIVSIVAYFAGPMVGLSFVL